MTNLAAHLQRTLYAVAADLGKYGIASADMTPNFDDACTEYGDFRAEGHDAAVLEISLADGAARDVTKAADARIAQWQATSRKTLPAWMEVVA